MYGVCLQDWVTIQSVSTSLLFTQTEPVWLDTSGYLDLVVYMQVEQVSSSPSGNVFMALQTAPTKDDNLFLAMNDIASSLAVPMAVGVQVMVLLRDTCLCPLSHWLRWQMSWPSGSTVEATFRIWCALNQPGGVALLSQVDPSAVNMQFEGSPAWTVQGSSTKQGPSIGTPALPPPLLGDPAVVSHVTKLELYGQPLPYFEQVLKTPQGVAPTRGTLSASRILAAQAAQRTIALPSKPKIKQTTGPRTGNLGMNNARLLVPWIPPGTIQGK